MPQPQYEISEEIFTSAEQISLERIVTIGKALSDPIRVRMLRLLAQGREAVGLPPARLLPIPGRDDLEGICVHEFQEVFRLGQSKVSYHLRILREAGLVTEEPRGKWSFYRLNQHALRAVNRLIQEYLHP
ncbi:MAG: ArsR/SmtB family transcription factor [Bacillota bacterium]